MDILPGLSRSWNFQKKSRTFHDFPGGMGTLLTELGFSEKTQVVLQPYFSCL